MSNDILERFVGDIVLENPKTANVFTRHGIDFCCGGQRKLSEALYDTKSLPENILAEIESLKATEEETLQDSTLTQLVNYIDKNHHKYLKQKLPEISALLKRVRDVHGDNHPELFDIYDNFITLKEELTAHIRKEEKDIFPLLKELDKDKKALDNAKLGRIIKEIESDHQRAGKLFKSNKKLSHDYTQPKDACTSYRLVYKFLKELEQETLLHIHLENNLLHPKVKARLS